MKLSTEATDKQRNVLNKINEFKEREGYSPTLRDLANELKLSSKNAVLKHLTALVKKGYINREIGVARSITVLDKGRQGFHTLEYLEKQLRRDSLSVLALDYKNDDWTKADTKTLMAEAAYVLKLKGETN